MRVSNILEEEINRSRDVVDVVDEINTEMRDMRLREKKGGEKDERK